MKNDLETDDEALRIVAMTGGEQATKAGPKLRATAALEISWMQRNGVLEPVMDIIWRACAFAFIHSEDKAKVRSVANDKDGFQDAVDEWMEKTNPNADQIKEYSDLMNVRLQEWFASASSDGKEPSPGN